MKNITGKVFSIILIFLLMISVLLCVYHDVDAVEYNTEATRTRRERSGDLDRIEFVYNNISEDEYNTIVARENASGNIKLTDSYWSKFSEPYYNYIDEMSDEKKQIYDKIYYALYKYIDGGEDFTRISSGINDYYATPAIACGDISDDELRDLGYLIVYEHPELYYIDSMVYINSTVNGNTTIQFEVFDDFAKGNDRVTGADTLRSRIDWYLAQVDGKSLYDKEKQIHDLICKNVEYDVTNPRYQSSYSAIVDGKCVCAGYSEGFAMLCHAVGIPAISVTSELHEWNEVRLGNTWYSVDVTWDDDDTGIYYDFFDKSDETMKSYDEYSGIVHTVEEIPWDYVGRPVCPKDYDGDNIQEEVQDKSPEVKEETFANKFSEGTVIENELLMTEDIYEDKVLYYYLVQRAPTKDEMDAYIAGTGDAVWRYDESAFPMTLQKDNTYYVLVQSVAKAGYYFDEGVSSWTTDNSTKYSSRAGQRILSVNSVKYSDANSHGDFPIYSKNRENDTYYYWFTFTPNPKENRDTSETDKMTSPPKLTTKVKTVPKTGDGFKI